MRIRNVRIKFFSVWAEWELMKLESATEKIFTCDACKYTFSAAKYEKRCPDCGKLQVRSASPKEIDDYIQIQMEIVQAENHIL